MPTRKNQPKPSHPDSNSVESRILTVGRELARTLKLVLAELPGGPHRPQELARALGLNTVLTSRLLRGAQHLDPMAVIHLVPGPEPLRRFLRAVEKKKVSATAIQQASEAVDRFAQLIDAEAGDRSNLDAIISGWLPDARERVELIAKQSVFRGISQLLGTAADLQHSTSILYPSLHQPGTADSLWLSTTRGLRRVRPGLIVTFDTVHSPLPLLTLAGKPVEGLRGVLLEQFCSKPLPRIAVTHAPDKARYTLRGEDVGTQSAVDLAHATLLYGNKQLYRKRNQPEQLVSVAAGIATPCKAFIFDVLLHEDIYPGQQPTMSLYRGTLGDGPANPNDPSGSINQLDVIESIQPLGQGLAKFRAAENLAYQDILHYACEQRKWDPARLRGYRCSIDFPIYSSQVVMAFDLPPAPP